MSQPKAQTFAERIGFSDPDLKKPAHDEIMLWLDENVDRLYEAKHPARRSWSQADIDKVREKAASTFEYYKNQFDIYRRQYAQCNWGNVENNCQKLEGIVNSFESFLAAAPPACPPPRFQKTWEYPVVGRNKYVLGFIDLNVEVSVPTLTGWNIEIDGSWQSDEVSPEWHVRFDLAADFYFEVKPAIPSLGELLRQLSFYREHLSSRECQIVVVSPDHRYEAKIREQGYGFIKYEAAAIAAGENSK